MPRGALALKDENGRTVRRPNKYTPALGRKICERLMRGEALKAICKESNMPNMTTVCKWLISKRPDFIEFRDMYYAARRIQAEIRIDEIIEIADNAENDWKPVHNKAGEVVDWKPDNEAIQRSRVRIDTRKWFAAKMVPKIYGERVDHNIEATGDLAEILKAASNSTNDLPPPIDGEFTRE